MNNIILETKNLSKNFKGEKAAVKDISLKVNRNSIYGLLGPNGAGKSTILKMITGMLKPSSGEILFNGHKWNRKDLASIGSLIEEAPLYENLTAEENLKVRTTILNLPDSRIKEVLKIVELENTGKKRAGQFSMGMKQRLGIAIALLNNPELLILDEPTNGLDPFGIQELRELIKSFPEKGITVVLSSHMLSEVNQIADHIGIISAGVLGYEGDPKNEENLNSIKGTYCTDFWCYPMFRSISEGMGKPIPVGTMGLLIDNNNPALKYFPCEFYSTPQWWDIVMNSHLSILDDVKVNPIVQMIDNFERNHRLGLIYEINIEDTDILVCTSPLDKIENSISAGWLKYSLIQYILSPDFKPEKSVDINSFKTIFSNQK